MGALTALRAELPLMARLAAPVVIAELGWTAMGVVDIAMVGRLGPASIGAVGVGSILFFAVAVFGIGALLGLDPLVAQAFGARRFDDCQRWLVHGVGLSLLLSVPLTAFVAILIGALDRWGLDPGVQDLAGPYLWKVLWSMLPLLLYTTFRRYLQAIGLVTPVMTALVTANLVNVGVNWLLIFGNLGAPQLGVDGAAWATCISRIYLAVFLFVTILCNDRRRGGVRKIPLRLERKRLARLATLGLPAAVQVTLEVGVFAVVTLLAGQLEPVDLAAHQVVLNIASVTFMVPLGIGSAGAVRVGHAIGRCDTVGAQRAGWSALTLGGGFMTAAAIVFVMEPRALLSLFTLDAAVVQSGVALLLVAALFQLFDGLQGVATGVLRGLGDTRTPMLWNLGGHWVVGLPVGYLLAFVLGWGVVGLWIGLSIGLTVVGVVLVSIWWSRTRVWLQTERRVTEGE